MERVARIELANQLWQSCRLPLHHTRMFLFNINITGSHFLCYHYTNTADQAVSRIRTWPVFFTERFNKIAEKNLDGQKYQDAFYTLDCRATITPLAGLEPVLQFGLKLKRLLEAS